MEMTMAIDIVLSQRIGQLERKIKGMEDLERKVRDFADLEQKIRDLEHRVRKLERKP
jgi:hypothetical protein